MKIVKLFTLLFIVGFSSCSTVRVATDYDAKTDFSTYKTFAFYKKGIDKAKISNLNVNLRPADISPEIYYKITELLES